VSVARVPDADLADCVKQLALSLGFDLAGVAGPEPSSDTEFFRSWVAAGYAGDMHYLARRTEERVDPRRVMEGVRSILCVGLVYDPGPRPMPAATRGRVSRYAGGEDYHEVLLEQLEGVAAGLEALAQRPVRARAYVDTGPVLERALAARAGLGWIGKNACLIHPRLGSYFFLGVLLTDLALAADAPEPDHCGTCTACLEACPTDAFPAPGILDATRCIAYTTIELRGAIPDELRAAQGAHVFGCDICQEVCPWNLREQRRVPADPLGLRARLAPRAEWVAPDLAWLLSLEEEAWRAATRHSALRRAKRRALLRNALVAAGNSGEAAMIPLVRVHAASEDVLLAEHACWALARLGAA
jgi:epoxyqueuosine reductase